LRLAEQPRIGEPHQPKEVDRRISNEDQQIGRMLTLSIALPFALMTATAALAKDDDKKEHGAGKGAVKGAVAGKLLGVGAGTGAVVGGVSGAAKANKDKKDDKKKD
jgi:uncharacterized protein YqgC (DUF456 family)